MRISVNLLIPTGLKRMELSEIDGPAQRGRPRRKRPATKYRDTTPRIYCLPVPMGINPFRAQRVVVGEGLGKDGWFE
jgi:hypothetical protein